MNRSLSITLLAALPAAAFAQSAEAPKSPFSATTLRLAAYGEVEAPPDMATLEVGVQTTAPTAVDASRQNADRTARLVAAVKGAGVPDRDLQTAQISLSPQYAYESGQAPRLTGYQASNQVRVTVHDLSKLARVVDFAAGAGATNLGQVEFSLAAPTAAENSARVAAVKALEDKAQLYARATGYRIVRLVNLSEGVEAGVAPPRPMMVMEAMAKVATPTPIEEGEIKVRADITGVFELAK